MDSVALLLYIGGNIIIEHNTVQYSTSATKATRVSRSISFRELKEKVYRLLNIDSSKFTLKLSSKYSFNDKSRYVEAHLEIDDDNNLQFMLDISNDVQCLELFIETEPIERHVAVDDPESYIPRITQGLNALGFNSVGYNEDASTSAFAWHGATDQNRYTSDHDIGDWDHPWSSWSTCGFERSKSISRGIAPTEEPICAFREISSGSSTKLHCLALENGHETFSSKVGLTY
ncbi:serine/threonine-protein phosphatase 7 long form [Dorcoceras hygrometricum]|uniref:Serine/threonine-protein phosphatase 7 long form n=1 Tax=Dorcoceras hygrometricum TaxID=472368 RepID=A0A2Z7CSJ6_9LAMI|nr:serine/threonine-protein phosphatase 7 long form [Dorcoceras hygrometricum]